MLPENLVDLVDLGVAREHRRLGDHFGEDGSHRPQVERWGVRFAAQEDLRCSVPDGHNLPVT